MTPEEQRIAIGVTCGWSWKGDPGWMRDGDWYYWSSPDGVSYMQLPDYLNDLNAMAEAEQFAIFEEGAGSITASEEYGRQLIRIVLEVEEEGVPATLSGVAMVARATAAQRAESFLRTLNLWTE